MKRVQLFEFEDFAWFPSWLRTCLTNLIVVFAKLMGVGEVLSDILAPILKQQKLNNIVDLGSGAGGPMPMVLKTLNAQEGLSNVQLTMTDLYPNEDAMTQFGGGKVANINYHTFSVDATQIETAPEGIKTMVNCFHHMPPAKAKQILASAYENKQPILIYELTENKTPFLVWMLFLPLSLPIVFIMVLFMTPFVRPLTFRQLFFTYMIPIIPIFYAWDGQASMPRMYAMKDLDILLEGLSSSEYSWEKGPAKNKKGKAVGTYLLGLPKV